MSESAAGLSLPEHSRTPGSSSAISLATALVLACAAEAQPATIRLVQNGTTTLPGAQTSVVATLGTPVDTSKAFLVFNLSESTANPSDGQVSGQLTGPSSVTFQRVATGVPVTIEWYVAEFAGGVSVQRGSRDVSSGLTFDVTLSSPVDLSKAFPLVSYRTDGANFNCNDFVRAKVTTTTNLRLTTDSSTCTIAGSIVEWQVVEYQQARVRTGDLAFPTSGGTSLTRTATLAPAITDPSKAWLLYSSEGTPDSTAITAYLFRGQITNSTTLTFDRLGTGSGVVASTLSWYLVEFTDDTFVQHGSAAFAGAATTAANVTLPAPAAASRSIALGGEFMRGGRSPYSSNDVAGVAWFTFDLTTPTNLAITRAASGLATADVGWFVVTFGPTPTNLRSIGTTADYTAGTITVTSGSSVVTATGTTWLASNRGRGDRILINGVNYVIERIDSDTQLRLTTPYAAGSASYSFPNYLVARQFTTLAAWEDCIDGGAGACAPFPDVTASLVADDRKEVGIAYRDSAFTLASSLVLQGSTTDTSHTITLTADPGNRHEGTPGAGALVSEGGASQIEVLIQDGNVTLEWLEIVGANGASCTGSTYCGAVRVHGTVGDEPRNVLLQNLLIHDFRDAAVPANWVSGIVLSGSNVVGKSVTVRNTMIWDGDEFGIWGDEPTDTVLVENCSIDQVRYGLEVEQSAFTVRNTIATSTVSGHVDYSIFSGGSFAGSNNTSSDATAATYFTNPLTGVTAASIFVAANSDLHLHTGANGQVDSGLDLSATFRADIDAQLRLAGAWDRGADERDPTTRVTLMAFEAQALDSAVALEWRTGSELDNLGFHVHRGPSADGPWTRLTGSLVPGLGSSPLGQGYSWLDSGLVNGQRYYYRLEDVDTASVSTFHGPVSAVPSASTPPPPEGGGGAGGGSGSGGTTPQGSCPSWVVAAYRQAAPASTSTALDCAAYGRPEAVSLREVARDARSATLELRTGGFYAVREPAGTVRVFAPGFGFGDVPSGPALPVRRALVEAAVGRKARLASVEALDLRGFPRLRPSAVGAAEMQVGADGTVRPARRGAAAPRLSRGYLPQRVAWLAGTVFQGDTKSAVVELSPVRFDGYRQQLVLAERVRVRVVFSGRDEEEAGTGSVGRRTPRKPTPFRDVLARLHTSRRGLHAVGFEDLFPARQRGMAVSVLRLQRQGQPVPFHVEPAASSFGPGSTLYFHADEAAPSDAFSSEVAWELVRSTEGRPMAVASAAPAGTPIGSTPTVEERFESNRVYQPGLLDAPDLWLWDAVVSGSVRVHPFALSGVDTSSPRPAELVVHLQGGSDAVEAPQDHHVRVSVNGIDVGDTLFDGKRAHALRAEVPASLLREGPNEVALVNVGDTGVSSLVFLDRFTVSYPQAPTARGGRFEGAWPQAETAEVGGLGGPAVVVDLAGSGTDGPTWLTGWDAAPGAVRFRAEAGRRYVVATRDGLLVPRVEKPLPSTLRDTANQADYLVIGPRDFLEKAAPLLERRASQGLNALGVAFEEIAEVFGHGQPSAEAIRDFLSFAYHSWSRPSPRYVVLLGDSSYDPRHFQAASLSAPLPALWAKTSYLWTVSDPLLAAVNGDDALPDLAIGRLPAQTPDEAETLVAKLLAWEDSGQGLSGSAALVADNPDAGGDFEADIADIASGPLAGRIPQVLRVGELGAATRPAIQAALDSGLSLMSYVGHGGAAVWASENVWNSWDAASLQAQSRQPLLLTLNCLNGYFVAPSFDALTESMLKAEGRGAIAGFSPSGLSLDGPAHAYHRALLEQIAAGTHERLGDALLAAQRAYAATGLMPEMLSVYHLLGDPATRIR